MNTSEYVTRFENAFLTMRRNAFQDRGHDQNLRPPEFFLLKLLWQSKANDTPPTPTELARQMCVSFSAITHHLNALEKRGLIERIQSIEDRRMFMIKLSKSGERMLQKQHEKHREMITAFIDYLGPKDAEQLVRIIERTNDFYAQYNRGQK